MSGIVGSFFNHRGSGIVAKLGSDGHSFNSGGVGVKALTEAAGGFAVGDITGATALAEEPAGTDEIAISDGGTLKRLDLTHMMTRPAFYAGKQTVQAITGSQAILECSSERFDTDSAYDTSTYRFTPGVAGLYVFGAGVTAGTASDVENVEVAIYENASDIIAYGNTWNGTYSTINCVTIKEAVDADDYFEGRSWASSDINLQGGMDKIFFYGYRLIGGGDGT